MRKCTRCGKRKSKGEFYRTTKTKSGLRSECKDCSHHYSRQWYLKRKSRGSKKKCKWCGRNVKEDKYTFCSNRCARKYEFSDPKNHPNWQGGLSRKSYPQEFDEKLKEETRERFNYVCQDCGRTQEEELKRSGRKLAVNHINHNKDDCNEDNLNVLCGRCNVKAGFQHWKTNG